MVQNIAHLHATICNTFSVIDQGPKAPYNLRYQAQIFTALHYRVPNILWIEGALVYAADPWKH